MSTPTPFTPGKYASAEPATAYLSYTVTIVNNTGDVYEPAVFFTSVQSGDQEADQVFDSENNLTGSLERNRFRGHRLSGEFVNVPIA